jgi:hypothetical protein
MTERDDYADPDSITRRVPSLLTVALVAAIGVLVAAVATVGVFVINEVLLAPRPTYYPPGPN